jgi:hypothetical protein
MGNDAAMTEIKKEYYRFLSWLKKFATRGSQSFPSLTTDHAGRRWVSAQFEGATDIDEILVNIFFVDEDLTSHAVGNGFVILDQGSSAICLTASHNFDYIKRLQKKHKPSEHPSLPPDFAHRGTEYLDTRGIHVLFVRDKKSVFCKIHQMNYQAGYDVAVFSIQFDSTDNSPASFTGKAAVDLAMPIVGDEVAMLGYHLTHTERGGGNFELERRLQFFHGVVTAVTPGPTRMGQSFCFETTIPIAPGLSGSPILKKPSLGGPVTVAGVASFDFSTDEAFKSFLVAGNSNVACLWPSLALGITAQDPKTGSARFSSIYEFVSIGAVDVKTKGVEFKVDSDNTHTRIMYVDNRSQPPQRLLLTTPLNPAVKQSFETQSNAKR